MSRREIVVMVSRAIAVLLVVPSVISLVLIVPTQLFAEYMRESLVGGFHSPASSAGLARLQWVNLTGTMLNVGLQVSVGLFFWFCGPAAERMLLPIPA